MYYEHRQDDRYTENPKREASHFRGDGRKVLTYLKLHKRIWSLHPIFQDFDIQEASPLLEMFRDRLH